MNHWGKKKPPLLGANFNIVLLNQSLATWTAKLDLRLDALFLWMTLFLANLSNIAETTGSISAAFFASVVARRARTAFRAVLW